MPVSSPLFLRSPPFPGVPVGVAAVSAAGPGRTVADRDGLFAALRHARVGGAFWGAADPWSDVVAACDGPDDERAMIGWLAGRTVHHRAGGTIDPSALAAAVIAAVERAGYRDPFTGEAIDALGAIEILAQWRRLFDANRPVAAAAGMAAWKREAIARFLWDGERSPPFLAAADAVARARQAGGAFAYWPSRMSAAVLDANPGVAAWQVEDGFVRSSGLGAECRPPLSVIVDPTGGIHYDPSRPSHLETILATAEFSSALLARAARLRTAIIGARLGKYGVDRPAAAVSLPTDRRTVLAIGQVEDDLSVRKGGGDVAGNLDLLRRVRADEPDSFIVYRPHPDVMAGLRRGHVATDAARALVDRVDAEGPLLPLVERVDCVHVLSSLTGFEALLRGTAVTTHGLPFYAGWGLTRDLATVPSRRGRALSLDALVAAALILAPRYLDPDTGLPCSAETLVGRLALAGRPRHGLVTGFRRAFGVTRRTLTKAGIGAGIAAGSGER